MPSLFRKNIILTSLFILLVLLVSTDFAFGQRPLEVEYPEIEGVKPETTSIGLPDFAKYIFNFTIGFAGLFVLGLLIYAGFLYLISTGSLARRTEAKDQIKAAILGLLIIFGSYLILTTINPRLIMVAIPELETITERLGGFPSPPPKTLVATEIPLGGLIEKALDEESLNSLQKAAGDIQSVAEDINVLAQEIKSLAESCTCGNTSPNAGSCSYSEACPATFCTGDPCPAGTREEIASKRQEIEEKTRELGLLLDSFKELASEKNRELQNLKGAEELIKDCQNQGKLLLSDNDFEAYEETLKEDIEGKDIQTPWSEARMVSQKAIFYCSNLPYTIEETDVEKLGQEAVEEAKKIPSSVTEEIAKKSKYLCTDEILVGQLIEEAVSLADKIIQESQLIIVNSDIIFEAGQNLADLAGQCRGPEACSTGCNQYTYECGSWKNEPCGEKCFEDELGGETCETIYCPVYYPETCEACDVLACSGSPCPNRDIDQSATNISSSFSIIESSSGQLKDLIEEKEGGQTEREKILEKLEKSDILLTACFNTSSVWDKFRQGKKTPFNELISCETIEMFKGVEPYPYYKKKTEEPITQCQPGNYFCCQAEAGSGP